MGVRLRRRRAADARHPAGGPGGYAVSEKRVDYVYAAAGRTATVTRYSDLACASRSSPPRGLGLYDGDGAGFQLACEAKRIDLAFLFDPMMAVRTSNFEPLPHQITTMSESMLRCRAIGLTGFWGGSHAQPAFRQTSKRCPSVWRTPETVRRPGVRSAAIRRFRKRATIGAVNTAANSASMGAALSGRSMAANFNGRSGYVHSTILLPTTTKRSAPAAVRFYTPCSPHSRGKSVGATYRTLHASVDTTLLYN